MSVGQGIALQPRDVAWLKYLAHGPAKFEAAKRFYLKKDSGEPLKTPKIYERLAELKDAEFIVRHRYKSLETGTVYYLGPAGVQELMLFYGYEGEHVRDKIVPTTHIIHELLVAGVLRKIYEDSMAQKLYKVLMAYDDRYMKVRNKYKKGLVYPDLYVRLQPFVGSTTTLLFEIEGINLRFSRFVKKLAGIKERLFVVTMNTARMQTLYRYTEMCNRRPPELFFTSIADFSAGGIMQTKWLHYPSKKYIQIRFK
jgi:hypothetical protein